MRILKLLALGLFFILPWCSPASAAEVDLWCWVSNGPPIQWAPCSTTNPLPITGSILLAGTVSNASSAVATSTTNIGSVAYNYGFNGTTWDQLQVDASKFLKVNVAVGAVTTSTSDPCQSASKSSAAINVTSGTTTSVVAVSGATVVYVCGFAITIAPSAVAAATALFEYGVGATCTSPTVLTGTFGNGDLTSAAGVAPILYGNGGATIFKSAASAGVCILTAGNAVNVQGVLTYVQQ